MKTTQSRTYIAQLLVSITNFINVSVSNAVTVNVIQDYTKGYSVEKSHNFVCTYLSISSTMLSTISDIGFTNTMLSITHHIGIITNLNRMCNVNCYM